MLESFVKQWRPVRLPLSALMAQVKVKARPYDDYYGVLEHELRRLETDGRIIVPKTVWKAWPALSGHVKKLQSLEKKVTRHDTSWVQELAWVPAEGAHHSLDDLRLLNEWFKQPRDGLVVPVRERSLQIFGDEKRLEQLSQEGVLFGRLTFADLGCEYLSPPLARVKVGTGPSLVVENHTTFHVMARACSEGFLGYGEIIYGGGNQVVASVDQIPVGSLYFGDLDKAGLRIAGTLNRLGVKPAAGLYELLICQTQYARKLDRTFVIDRRDAAAFDEALVRRFQLLFDDRRWLPQEALMLSVICSTATRKDCFNSP